MSEARTNLRELAALSSVLREVLDGIKALGHPAVAAQEAALDAVDAFIRGAKLTKAEAKRLTRASFDEIRTFNHSSPPPEKAAFLANGPVQQMIAMAATGAGERDEALEGAGHAFETLRNLPRPESKTLTQALYAKALETHAGLSDAPLAEKPARVDSKTVAAESDELAKARDVLPPFGQKLLDRAGAARDPKQIGTDAQLRAMLAKHDYPAWDVVVRFNQDLGGLLIPNTDAKGWRDENAYHVVGPYAGLAAGGDRMCREGLVPVYFGADDMIGFLDDKGEAWLGGVLDGQLTALRCSGVELVTTCLAYGLLQTGGKRLKGIVGKAGLVGETIAETLSLLPIASYGPARVWASGDAIVSELNGTQLAGLTEAGWSKVQNAVAQLDPSAADLFGIAKSNRTLANVDRAFAALLAEIRQCASLADVKHVLSPYVLAALHANDGELRWRDVASALVVRAESMTPDEGGRTLGWIARRCALQVRLEGWENDSLRQRVWSEGIGDQARLLREWMKDVSPERRAGAAYALGWCPSPSLDDAAAILDAIGHEKDTDALATELVVAGWLARATGADRVATAKALRSVVTTNPVVATCAAAGLVWLAEPLSHKEVDVLLRQSRRSSKLPALWDMKDIDGSDTGTGLLAYDALTSMSVAEPETTIAAARAMLAEPKLRASSTHAAKAALARAAFDGRRPVPREGVALEELSLKDREILAQLLDGIPLSTHVFGLSADSLREMVAQTRPEWRPIELVVGGVTRHWHFARIVGAVAVGQVEPEAGRAAVLAALSPTEAATLVGSWSKQLEAILCAMTGNEELRALSTCLEVLDEAKKAGADVEDICVNLKYAMSSILALWSIRAHNIHLPVAHYQRVGAATWRPELRSVLRAAIRGLPVDVQTEIFHRYDPYVFDFWGPLDEVTVPNILWMATRHPNLTGAVVATLRKGGSDALAKAEAVTSTNPNVEVSLAIVCDALRRANRR